MSDRLKSWSIRLCAIGVAIGIIFGIIDVLISTGNRGNFVFKDTPGRILGVFGCGLWGLIIGWFADRVIAARSRFKKSKAADMVHDRLPIRWGQYRQVVFHSILGGIFFSLFLIILAFVTKQGLRWNFQSDTFKILLGLTIAYIAIWFPGSLVKKIVSSTAEEAFSSQNLSALFNAVINLIIRAIVAYSTALAILGITSHFMQKL